MSNVVTKFSGVIKSTSGDSFAVEVLTTKESYIVGITQSDFVFDTEADAHAGAKRAITRLGESGIFPNMNGPF